MEVICNDGLNPMAILVLFIQDFRLTDFSLKFCEAGDAMCIFLGQRQCLRMTLSDRC
jgi:hypothetical protein